MVYDLKFKEDIRPIYEVINKINKLKGISFKWKRDHTKPREIGVIAEEIAEVFP